MSDAPSASEPATKADAAGELPFDPLRLLGGIWRRRGWLLLGAVVGLGLGFLFGWLRSSTRYEASIRLMRQEVPSGIRASEAGDAYRPHTINNATLLSAAVSDNVLAHVATKAEPPVSLGLLRQNAIAREQRGTDFLQLVVSGYTSGEATVALANLWGKEVVEFSRQLQSRESREMRAYLEQQLAATNGDLTRLKNEILKVSQRIGLIDAQKEIDAYLRSISELDLRYETTRIELQTTEFRIKNLEAELTGQSPTADKLRTARSEFELSRHTDEPAAVTGKWEKIRMLEAIVAREAQSKPGDLSRFTGTTLGNTLYIQLGEERARQVAYTRQLAQFEQLRATARTKLESIPGKAAELASLMQTKTGLETASNVLFARLREARLFEENAPGYFQVFSAATIDSVAVRPLWLKVLVFSGGGLVAGFGLALLGSLGSELLDRRLRTAAEARRLVGRPVWLHLKKNASQQEWRRGVERLWLQWIGPARPTHALPIVWAPQPEAGENDFWQGLIFDAERLVDGIIVVDAGATPNRYLATLPAITTLPASFRQGVFVLRLDPATLSLSAAQEKTAWFNRELSRMPIFLRLSGPIMEPAATLARAGRPPLLLVPADAVSLDFWQEQVALLKATVAVPDGLVVWNEPDWYRRAPRPPAGPGGNRHA